MQVFDRLPGFPRPRAGRASDHSYSGCTSARGTTRACRPGSGELYLEYHRGTYTSQSAHQAGQPALPSCYCAKPSGSTPGRCSRAGRTVSPSSTPPGSWCCSTSSTTSCPARASRWCMSTATRSSKRWLARPGAVTQRGPGAAHTNPGCRSARRRAVRRSGCIVRRLELPPVGAQRACGAAGGIRRRCDTGSRRARRQQRCLVEATVPSFGFARVQQGGEDAGGELRRRAPAACQQRAARRAGRERRNRSLTTCATGVS